MNFLIFTPISSAGNPNSEFKIQWQACSYEQGILARLTDGIATNFVSMYQQFAEHVWLTFNLQEVLRNWQPEAYIFEKIKFIDLLTESKMLLLPFLNTDTKPKEFSIEVVKNYIGLQPSADLFDIFRLLLCIHSERCTGLHFDEMILRTEFIKATVYLEQNSLGFPVDSELISDISTNRVEFIRHLQAEVNRVYGQIFVDAGVNRPLVFNERLFSDYVKRKGYHWEVTGSGRSLLLEQSYLKIQARLYPELNLFYQTLKTLKALNSTDLSNLCVDGYIKPKSEIFNQKTGRTSPIPSGGFILNLPAWIRGTIRPKLGKVMIGVDWSQQEIAIAAALSNDSNYMALYNDGGKDVYLALAKLAGAVPSDATKASHGAMRQTFKAVQLGLGYGKGIESLANDVYATNFGPDGTPSMTQQAAKSLALQIMDWHKTTFSDYWQWLNETVRQARAYRYIKSLDGWTYLLPSSARDTQLLNFPMQANGSAILRRAVIHAANRKNIDVICTLHDAIYINADESEQERAISDLLECMDQACDDILQGKIRIRTDISVYTSEQGYVDEGGAELLEHFRNFIALKKNRAA